MADESKGTRRASPTADEKHPPVAESQGGAELAPSDLTDAALEVMQSQTELAGLVLGSNPGEITPANVSEQAVPSAAYGDFVRKIGLAVADAQRALDENSVKIALQLAQTTVPALIALNQIVNEDGELEKVEPVIQSDAKLIQFIQPAFYQFTSVTLFAQFDVSKFESDGSVQLKSTASVSNSYARVAGGVSGIGPFVRYRAGMAAGASNTTVNRETSIDSEYEAATSRATSHMQAVIEPRNDTRFPPPLIATQGPRLTVSAAATSLAAPRGDAVASLPITITLFKKDGFRDTSNKGVDLTIDGPGLLNVSTVALTPVPNDAKRLQATVNLTRRASDIVGTATIRATIGGLSGLVSINFPPQS